MRVTSSALALLISFASLLLSAASVPGATAEDYRIGAGDVLFISVWDNKDLDQKVFVRPDGKISLSLLGEIPAGGRTVAELASALTDMYGKTVKGAQVVVDVTEIRSRAIYFLGGVNRPGPLQLNQDMNLLQAIALAGGLSPAVDLGAGATLLRGDKAIPINFVKLIQHGDQSQNVKVEPGDTIVVPIPSFVYLQGEVKTPGAIRYTRGLTIAKAIVQAGGFTPLAASKRVLLVRGTGDKKQTMEVNVRDITAEGASAQDVPLEPDDILTVPQRLF